MRVTQAKTSARLCTAQAGISLGKFQEGFNAGIVMLVIAIADGDQH